MLINRIFMRVIAVLCAVFLVLGELLSIDLITAYADESNKISDRIIVSLGDSYSSGEGIEPFYDQDLPLSQKVKSADWLAHRSQNAWGGMLTLEVNGETIKMGESRWYTSEKTVFDLLPQNVSNMSERHWYFAAASGAVTNNIKETTKEEQGNNPPDGSQKKEYKKGNTVPGSFGAEEGAKYLAPQLDIFDALGSRKADYVTLTIGGNDAGFTDIVTTMVLFDSREKSYLVPNAITGKLTEMWKRFYEPSGIKDSLKDTYKRISEKAGNQAHIIVAGYPILFYEDPKKENTSATIDSNEAHTVNEAVKEFNKQIGKIVEDCKKEGLNIEFVSVEKGFDGHEAYSTDPYINEIFLGAKAQDLMDSSLVSAYSMHPNLKGAQVYANCVQKAIDDWEEKKGKADQKSSSANTGSAYEQYIAAAKKTTQTGAWSEKMDMEANMMITQDRTKAKAKMSMHMDSDISNYAEDDLSQLKVHAKLEMEAARQKYSCIVDYHDGVGYYQFTEPDQKSYSMEIDPNIYNFESVSRDTILEEKISNGKLYFLLDGDKVAEAGFAAIQQMNGVAKLKCGDIEMIVTLTDEGRIDQVEMNFDASVEYMGYDADATYKLTYAFIL